MGSQVNCSRLAGASVRGRTDERTDPDSFIEQPMNGTDSRSQSNERDDQGKKTQDHVRTSMKKGNCFRCVNIVHMIRLNFRVHG